MTVVNNNRSIAPGQTRLRFVSDPVMPHRFLMTIETSTRIEAAAEIAHAVRAAERDYCFAQFFGPYRTEDIYVAYGEIIDMETA